MCKTLLMSRFFFCLFTLLTATFLTAQTIPRTDNICFFQDAKTGQPITIVNDSLVYKGELKNPSILKHTDYPEVLERYKYHFNINKHTYLVNVGCGPVLEYRNDSIVRIDNSFLQKNQYGAAPFVYKNQICLFGGYGLFLFKNLITRFDFKTKEWFRLYTEEEEKPSERNGTVNFNYPKGMYIFAGFSADNTIKETYENDPRLWFLNYSTLKWQSKGNYNKKLKNINLEFTFQSDTKSYILNEENIVEIDFINNIASFYKYNNPLCFNKISYNQKTKSLYYLANLSGEVKLILAKITLSELLKHPIKTEKLYYSPWQEYALPLVFLLMVLLVIFGVYKWILFQKGKCFVFHKNKNKFYYKTKIISNLDPMEEKILAYLFENKKTFIQLNQLNSFFEKENPDNVSNIIKKRDLIFSSLLVKLNAIVTQNESPLILLQKNEIDKRIKEIRLNPLYFTLKNN